MPASIRQKLLKGSIWNSLAQFGAQGINFVLVIILARLLEPRDFGLLGMVLVITGFLGYFSEFGFIASMIQKKEVDEIDCNTVYWSSIGFSFLLYAIVFFAAPLVSLFYGSAELTLITRITFIGFIFKPFGFIQFILETKALNYDKIAIAELVSVIISGVCAVVLAFLGYGVWSLVAQQVIKDIVRAIALNVFLPWKPKFLFSILCFKTHFATGMHFTFNNVIKFSIENFDYLLVGKLIGAQALGIYTLAFRLARYPLEKIWHIFGSMLFPAFSKLQSDIPKLKKGMVQVGVLGGFIVVPYLLFVTFGIEYLIPFLGDKWIPTIPVVRIFVVYLLLFSVSMADEPLLFAIGRVTTVNSFKFFNVILLLAAGIVAIKLRGLEGMAWAYTAVTSIYICGIKFRLLRILRLKLRDFIIGIRSVFMLTGLLFVSLIGYSFLVSNIVLNDLLIILGQGVIICFVLLGLVTFYKIFNIKGKTFDSKAVDKMMTFPGDV